MEIKNKNEITVITDPILYKSDFFIEGARRIFRFFRFCFKFFFSTRYDQNYRYRGHFAVTRSLIEGLEEANVKFNYNPFFLKDLSSTVLVLANVRALKQAIQLKRKGIIKKLYAGPNIVIYANDYDGIIASKEIDLVITPSEPIVALYSLDRPNLKQKIVKWPAGVDHIYWSPDKILQNKKQILIYEKQAKGPVGPILPYLSFLVSLGFTVKIIKYGEYHHGDYLNLLRQSILMVGFVTDESQGIAWAEAWSVDVPTFIWESNTTICRGREYSSLTAPYLNSQNGIYFKDLEDFKKKFTLWINGQFKFSPRNWLLENMTDEICAKKLMSLIAIE